MLNNGFHRSVECVLQIFDNSCISMIFLKKHSLRNTLNTTIPIFESCFLLIGMNFIYGTVSYGFLFIQQATLHISIVSNCT